MSFYINCETKIMSERGENFRHKEKKRSIEIGKQAAEASRGD